MKFTLLILLLFLFSLFSCGVKKSSESKDGSGSLAIEGTVSFLRNSIISEAYADEGDCTSTCDRLNQNCAILYKLSSDPSIQDEKLCETPIDTSGNYKFEIPNKEKVHQIALNVIIENFKGSRRESVFIIDGEVAVSKKDINPLTTVSSQSLKTDVKTGRQINTSSEEDHRTQLKNDLISMCPGVITSANVLYAIRNTLNILAKERGEPLFITYRNLSDSNSSLAPIQAEINSYCNFVNTLITTQTVSSLKVRLVDKSGNPYINTQMWVAENDGSIYNSSANGQFKTTDGNGYFDLINLARGNYSLVIGDYDWYSSNFLWTADEKYIGHFVYDNSLFYQEIVFPKVVERQSANTEAGLTGNWNLSAPTYYPSNSSKYYAQSFTLSSSRQFCGVGLGFGLGNIGRPDNFQIRADSGGTPSTILYENKVYGFTGALSKGGEDPFSNFCNKYTSVTLDAGTYWVVAAFDSSPSSVAILGWNTPTANGLPLKKSIDGTSWENANLSVSYNGTKEWTMLDFFLTE